jgi:hypothetical protein
MREPADAERVRRLATELGRVVPAETRMYLTGGATAVLEGWRASTVDIDVRLERGFELDRKDVQGMVEAELVKPARLLELFEEIEPELYRFPAVDPKELRVAVQSLGS